MPNYGRTSNREAQRSWRLGIVVAAGLFLGCFSACQPSAAQSQSRGKEALRSGDYAKARHHFEAALKSGAGQEESQVGLLQTLRETGHYDEARRRGEEFLAGRPGSAAVRLETARSLNARGEYASAEKHLRAAVPLGGPARSDVVRELALLLEGTGRQDEARNLWQQLVDQYRKGSARDSQTLGNVAVAAWRLGWAQDAKDLFMDATTGPDAPLEALSNFGYLFLEKYNATDALGVFRDCLKINKQYAEGLLGVALAKKYESSPEVEDYAKAALEVNSNLVPAMNLLAELRMQEENYDGALKEIRRALEVNPKDLDSLSLEAVYHHFKGDQARFAEVEQKALGINPSYGRFHLAIAENLVTRRKYQEAVDINRKALSLDAKLWPAYANLGINLMRVGDLAEGRKALQQAFDGDPFNVWAFNTLDLLDQMDKFSRFESEHFVFRAAKEDEPTLSRYAPRLAEEAYARLSERYGFKPAGPIQLEIFPDHGSFAVRTLGLPGLGALGVCFGKVIAMDSPRARKAGSFNWGSTLWHEFAHVITLQMTRHNVPRWFSEGVSVYEERRARPGWGDDLTAHFLKAYQEEKHLKVSELNAGMMRPKFPEQIALSYYQASLVCELIEEKFGFAKIREALALFAENHSSEEVFRRALGWDTATLDREYERFLEARIHASAGHLDFSRPKGRDAANQKGLDKEGLAAHLEKNPNDFFANLAMGALLRKEKSNGPAEVYLKKAQKLFPEFVESDNPYQILAEIYLEEKREDEALTQLLGWSRFDENSVWPLVRAAEIYRNRKDWAGAARVLELSVYIDPYDPNVHGMLGEAAVEAGNWPAAVAAYQTLVSLAPSDPAGAHYNLARAWLGYGKKQEAKRETLRALEIAPSYEKAQQLLLKLSGSPP
jgi:cellulose synthase operon protein C